MKAGRFAVAAALLFGASLAQAATTFASFTVASTQDITADAGSPAGEILSLELLSMTPDLSDIGPNLATLTFFDLSAGIYTLKLVTSGTAPYVMQVVDGTGHIYPLTTPVPEPETCALSLAGLAVAALLSRRRSATA